MAVAVFVDAEGDDIASVQEQLGEREILPATNLIGMLRGRAQEFSAVKRRAIAEYQSDNTRGTGVEYLEKSGDVVIPRDGSRPSHDGVLTVIGARVDQQNVRWDDYRRSN